MYVELGNVSPKEAHLLDERDLSQRPEDELRQLAVDKGVAADGERVDVVARLASVPTFQDLDGPRVTRVEFPEGTTLGEAFFSITTPGRGLWSYHSSAPPEWVESDSDALAALLCDHFGCTRGAPDALEDGWWTRNGPPGVGVEGPVGQLREGEVEQ